ncbi:hypothetical protein [Paenibacillus sp. N3.4]|uniref:hypothetical protein n=1 Tax=Paenibacillus sp. N3.4 TaxID=2603222 RepID=UPI0011C97AC8|nr:hypothetical protein [Paenibacillus sp. N3.4]TXK79632.1 hypothetical protein FU659_19675 [Paenibacillus sp. N3.4]
MNITNTFEVSKEIAALADQYNEFAESSSIEEIKNMYTELTFQLDEIHSKLLQIANFYPENKSEKIATTIKLIDGISLNTQLTLLHAYEEDHLALVEDECMELFLVPMDALKIDSD